MRAIIVVMIAAAIQCVTLAECVGQAVIPRRVGGVSLGMSEEQLAAIAPTLSLERCHECVTDERMATLSGADLAGLRAGLEGFGIDSSHAALGDFEIDCVFYRGALARILFMPPAALIDSAMTILVSQFGGWKRKEIYPSGVGFAIWNDSRTTLRLSYSAERVRPQDPSTGSVLGLEVVDNQLDSILARSHLDHR